MKRLRIAFGRSSGLRGTVRDVAALLFVAAATAAAGTAVQGWRIEQQVAQLSDAADALDDTARLAKAGAARHADDARPTPDQVAAVNRAVTQLNLPWHDLLLALERAQTPNVSLVSIEPDLQRGLVRVVAEASNPDGMLDYAAALAKQPGFQGVAIRKHQLDLQSPYQPVRFTLELAWRRAASGGAT